MRRSMIVAVATAALAGLGAISMPAHAAVSASACYSVNGSVNGQAVVDQANCVTAP